MARPAAERMTFVVLSDVHAEFDALTRVAQRGEPLVILGDLVNLIDHRTIQGIIPDVVGAQTVERLAALRRSGRSDEARTVWLERTAACKSRMDRRPVVGPAAPASRSPSPISDRG